jgi:hypothetical protein
MRLEQELIALQRFLECRAHEMVASPRMRQDLEVNPEKREIDERRQDDETKNTGEEVFYDMFLHRPLET